VRIADSVFAAKPTVWVVKARISPHLRSRGHHAALGYLMIVKTIFST
jgi:hypothetical protein